MKKLKTEVAIIGGGMSGLTASVALAENEVDVIVLEKSGTTGGAANMGMGFFAAGSHIQHDQLINFGPDDAFKTFMEFTHWEVDANLVRKYVDQSASTVKWLEDMGVEFQGAFKYFMDSYATWHVVKVPGSNRPTERAASVMIGIMTQHANDLGVQFMFNTPATEIIMKNGRAAGVKAVAADGEEIEIEADAVVIASGGFGDDPEMIKEFTGFTWGKDLFSFRIPGLKGDGMKMAWAVGAGKSDVSMEMIFFCPQLVNMFSTMEQTMRQPTLMVNLDGRRFMNEKELVNTPFTGNAISRQREGCAFTIITENILEYFKTHPLDHSNVQFHVKDASNWDVELKAYLNGESGGFGGLSEMQNAQKTSTQTFFIADSLEELCEKTGIDLENLRQTIEEYNANAYMPDKKFCKDAKYMRPLLGNRFYCAKQFPGGYGTLGGIKADDSLRVLREDFSVIPGLYSCGTDVNTLYAGTYCFYMPGNTMGFAINSGRMIGKNVVEYLDSDEYNDYLESQK